MTKRNLWGYEETLALISIFDEKEILLKMEEKKHSATQLYQLIEQEMFARGYYDKNAKQMEFRWRNLKKIFFKDRKMLERAEPDYKVSPYFDQMEIVLANYKKPVQKVEAPDEISRTLSVTLMSNAENGNASSDEEEEDPPKTEMPAFEECFPSLPAPKPRLTLKRPHSPDSMLKIDAFHQKIKKVTNELNEDLYRKQKELIEYEFRLFANYTTSRDERFKEMMATNTQTFLNGIKDLLQEKNNITSRIKTVNNQKIKLSENLEDHTIKQFFQSWDQEPANRK